MIHICHFDHPAGIPIHVVSLEVNKTQIIQLALGLKANPTQEGDSTKIVSPPHKVSPLTCLIPHVDVRPHKNKKIHPLTHPFFRPHPLFFSLFFFSKDKFSLYFLLNLLIF